MSKKKSDEKPEEVGALPEPVVWELFVFGVNEENKEFRGGRFATVTDQVIEAAKGRGYTVIVKPPELFTKLAMEMPVGRAFSDKVIFQALGKTLYKRLVEAEKLIPQFRDLDASGVPLDFFNNDEGLPDTEEPAPLPTYPNHPRDWSLVDVGDLVLITAGAEYGYWEAIVVQRQQEILFLRLRDEPKQGTFIRHRQGVALLNPGPQQHLQQAAL
ncbi:MAG: hypothetical protein EKK36_05325 [Bradyrhizobiaceae bacterium]|nr:MAG: hypothetical protein EKK36_05325 [Bradyrhizobiaceae bacterium]